VKREERVCRIGGKGRDRTAPEAGVTSGRRPLYGGGKKRYRGQTFLKSTLEVKKICPKRAGIRFLFWVLLWEVLEGIQKLHRGFQGGGQRGGANLGPGYPE